MSKSTVQLDVRQAMWSRRNVLKTSAGVLAGIMGAQWLPSLADELSVPHIVVVGGGFGGATVAKYLKLWGKDTVKVTLIEPNAQFMSPIMSGMVITGQLEADRISFGYERLRDVHGVTWVQDRVTAIDSVAKTVTLEGIEGVVVEPLAYDRLILSPGIDFVDVPGWDPLKLPHAWGSRAQADLLQAQLNAFPEGGVFVINVPTYPFRCPPGPYERASAVADYLRVKNKNAQVVVLDTQPDIFVENSLFHALYDELGVQYRGNSKITAVNSGQDDGSGRSVTFVTLIRNELGEVTGQSEPETLNAHVINLIPDNKAAAILYAAGLLDANQLWAPIHPLTYRSTIVGKEAIYILGDSIESAQSKAGQMANAQAKVCADAMLRELAGQPIYEHPITTAGGFAALTQTKVNWIGVSYAYDPAANNGAGDMVRTHFASAPEPSEIHWQPMLQWANNLFADTFG